MIWSSRVRERLNPRFPVQKKWETLKKAQAWRGKMSMSVGMWKVKCFGISKWRWFSRQLSIRVSRSGEKFEQEVKVWGSFMCR